MPPQTFAMGGEPPPQVCGGVQVPQLRMLPQPSVAMPQLKPWAWHDLDAQPHTVGVTAPQTSGATHGPQPSGFSCLPFRPA